jgi:hypothetical protein
MIQIYYNPGTFGMFLSCVLLLQKLDSHDTLATNDHSHDEWETLVHSFGSSVCRIFHGLSDSGQPKLVSGSDHGDKIDPNTKVFCPVFNDDFKFLRYQYNFSKYWRQELTLANYEQLFSLKPEKHTGHTHFYLRIINHILYHEDYHPQNAEQIVMNNFFESTESFIEDLEKLFGFTAKDHVKDFILDKRQRNITAYNDYREKFVEKTNRDYGTYSDFDKIISITVNIQQNPDGFRNFRANWQGESMDSYDHMLKLLT